jgi:bifunctional non-homologous end joining protein LigD
LAPLTAYRAKRDFGQTREPKGRLARGAEKARRFVIQRHDATRLHYDLRLELGGVYRSWAVTKVPSLDPATKRLAVEVEDHPIDYGTFEGTIPQGQYGGGTVQLWDRGTWRPQSESSPVDDLAAGHLKFELDGERMHGGWALVRMRDREAKGRRAQRHNWLLIKEKDEAALPGEPDALLAAEKSVKTGRTLDEIADGVPRRTKASAKSNLTEVRTKKKTVKKKVHSR